MKLCQSCHRRFPADAQACPEHGNSLRDDPLLGLRLGPFVIEDWLGEGGLGVVYRGEHVEIRRPVAIKVLKREFIGNEQTVQRFFREAQAVSKIAHPHLIDIFDLGKTDDGQVYYVMELLAGRTLSARMAAGPLPFEELVHVVRDACEAIEAAHALGIIHRDLKPDNLFLIDRPGELPFVKVLDFGIAKVLGLDEGVQDRLTRTGTILGTPQYMAPEQIEGEPIDQRTDVYALGVILYELATGTLPFRAQTIGGMLKAHLLDAPPHFGTGQLSPGVPPELEGVVLRALRKRADDRYAGVRALREDIDRVAAGQQPEASAWWLEQHRAGQVADDKLPAYLASSAKATVVGTVDVAALKAQAQARGGAAEQPRSRGWVRIGVGVALVAIAGGGFVYWRGHSAHTVKTVVDKAAPPAKPAVNLGAMRSRALGALSAALKDGDPTIRKQALDALARTRDGRHHGLIEPLLSDPDVSARRAAASALAEIGARAAVPELRTLLGSPPRLDFAVADALLRLGDQTPLKPLKDTMKKGTNDARLQAALLLVERDADAHKLLARHLDKLDVTDPFGSAALARLARTDAKARARLVDQLAAGNPAVQLLTAQTLARLGDEAGRSKLSELADEASPVRLPAFRALAQLDDQTGFDVFKRTLADAARPSAERIIAAQGLGASGEKAVIPELSSAIDAEDPSLRVAAAGAILEVIATDPGAVAAKSVDWATAALTDDAWAVREQAVAVLADADPKVAVPLLGRALHDDQPEVRRTAASSLGRTRSAAAVSLLGEALDDEKRDVRMVALASLGKINHPSAAPILKKHIARNTASRSERVVAAGQLVKLGDRSQVAEVTDGLKSSEPEVRALAVEASAADPALAKDAASAALKDSVFAVRFAAGRRLAEQGSSEGVSVLQEGARRGGSEAIEAYSALAQLHIKPDVELDPVKLLAAGDAHERVAIVESGSRLRTADATTLFGHALDDGDARVRIAAVDGLGALDNDAGGLRGRLLKRALADEDVGVRSKAGLLFARLAPRSADATEAAAEPAPVAVTDLAAAPDLQAVDLAVVDLSKPPDLAAPVDLLPAQHGEDEEGEIAMTSGEIALKAGRFETAIRELQRAHKLNPKLPIFFSLGEAYRRSGDRETDASKQRDAYTKAIVAYQKSHEKRAAAYAAELTERIK